MGMRHIAGCNMIAQIKITEPDLSFHELQAVEYFWNNVFVSMLPSNIIIQQMEALDRVGSCSVHQASFTVIHVCLLCALRTKTSLLSQKFAFNCATSTLQCATCSRKATPIHMLGRVLRVKTNSYYLCTACLKPALWEAKAIAESDLRECEDFQNIFMFWDEPIVLPATNRFRCDFEHFREFSRRVMQLLSTYFPDEFPVSHHSLVLNQRFTEKVKRTTKCLQ
jgi:hypothetical protein